MLGRIQNDLFDLGADLATPDDGKPLGYEPLRIIASQTARVEADIDALNAASAAAANPSSCPAARRPRPPCIWPAPSRAAPSA